MPIANSSKPQLTSSTNESPMRHLLSESRRRLGWFARQGDTASEENETREQDISSVSRQQLSWRFAEQPSDARTSEELTRAR
jgi:hypothetical protein